MSKLIKSFFSLLFLISFTASVSAADYNLRMTMNSNDQDEDLTTDDILNDKLYNDPYSKLINYCKSNLPGTNEQKSDLQERLKLVKQTV